VREASAYGAALAAGMGAGLFAETDLKRLARYEREFLPRIGADEADSGFAKRQASVAPC
jgi:glycerol kinase